MITVRLQASQNFLCRRFCKRFLAQAVAEDRCRRPVEVFRMDPCMDPSIAAYLEVAKVCNANCGELQALTKLKVGETHVGYVTKQFGNYLAAYPDIFQYREEKSILGVNSQLKTTEDRTKAVGGVLQALRDQGIIGGWRDELYPVTNNFYSEPLFLVERAAAFLLGIKSYGVHINGYTYKNGELHMWVARRSKSKPTWPSRLDHIAAGGQPFGMGCMENVIKECGEEASIPVELAQKAHSCGAVSYSSLTPEGSKREVLFLYDLELPPDFVPAPCDGEVDEFMLLPIEKVAEIIQTTQEYKPNCALVVIDFMIRHGFITPEQPGYLQLVDSLRAEMCL